MLSELWQVIEDRVKHPREGSYVSNLLRDQKGIDRVLEKVSEEATEFILAVKNGIPERTVAEAADLFFHLLVALKASGTDLEAVMQELVKRRRG
ncbi:MAG: phosphoribosyl-ATP diphosphatase [Methanomicrobiales archaeon]|nr:phosphoribosyl-ATP diphosphatase [Methanomicrobiales archaeon]